MILIFLHFWYFFGTLYIYIFSNLILMSSWANYGFSPWSLTWISILFLKFLLVPKVQSDFDFILERINFGEVQKCCWAISNSRVEVMQENPSGTKLSQLELFEERKKKTNNYSNSFLLFHAIFSFFRKGNDSHIITGFFPASFGEWCESCRNSFCDRRIQRCWSPSTFVRCTACGSSSAFGKWREWQAGESSYNREWASPVSCFESSAFSLGSRKE